MVQGHIFVISPQENIGCCFIHKMPISLPIIGRPCDVFLLNVLKCRHLRLFFHRLNKFLTLHGLACFNVDQTGVDTARLLTLPVDWTVSLRGAFWPAAAGRVT
jgi:hypothetical protein